MASPTFARTFAGVPTLVAEPAGARGSLPVVLWYHGFRADALAHAVELERCAALGFLAIGVDAVGHGARRDPALGARVAQSAGGALPVMLGLMEATVREVPAVLDAVGATYPIDRTRIAMVGISMGAFLVYRALALGYPIRAAVALLGAPEWTGPTSAHLSPGAIGGSALLSITAEHDVSVPPDAVVRLHAALGTVSDATADSRAASHHYVLRGAGHLTSAHEWQRAMRVTLQWLARHG